MVSQFLNEINYKDNENVKFFIDEKEEYIEPELVIKPALSFNKPNFEANLGKVADNGPSKETKIRALSPSSLCWVTAFPE